MTAEGENFLKWAYLCDPNVLEDMINPVVSCAKLRLDSNCGICQTEICELGSGTGILIQNVAQEFFKPDGNNAPRIGFTGVDILSDLIDRNNAEYNLKNDFSAPNPAIKYICADNIAKCLAIAF